MEVKKYKAIEDQAEAICVYINKCINAIQKDHIVIAVSGGKSPILLFKLLSNIDLPWAKISVTLVDDRLVYDLNDDSNAKLIKTYLLQNKAKDVKFIPLVSSLDMNDNLVNANIAIKDIDIAILGMGEDGHTASIFPDCPELNTALQTIDTYIITTPQSAKYQRIGLSVNALAKIPYLILSINGKTKLDVLLEANNGINHNYPISYLLKVRQDISTYWY